MALDFPALNGTNYAKNTSNSTSVLDQYYPSQPISQSTTNPYMSQAMNKTVNFTSDASHVIMLGNDIIIRTHKPSLSDNNSYNLSPADGTTNVGNMQYFINDKKEGSASVMDAQFGFPYPEKPFASSYSVDFEDVNTQNANMSDVPSSLGASFNTAVDKGLNALHTGFATYQRINKIEPQFKLPKQMTIDLDWTFTPRNLADSKMVLNLITEMRKKISPKRTSETVAGPPHYCTFDLSRGRLKNDMYKYLESRKWLCTKFESTLGEKNLFFVDNTPTSYKISISLQDSNIMLAEDWG